MKYFQFIYFFVKNSLREIYFRYPQKEPKYQLYLKKF